MRLGLLEKEPEHEFGLHPDDTREFLDRLTIAVGAEGAVEATRAHEWLLIAGVILGASFVLSSDDVVRSRVENVARYLLSWLLGRESAADDSCPPAVFSGDGRVSVDSKQPFDFDGHEKMKKDLEELLFRAVRGGAPVTIVLNPDDCRAGASAIGDTGGEGVDAPRP